MSDGGENKLMKPSQTGVTRLVKLTSGFAEIPQQMLDNSRQECGSVKGTSFFPTASRFGTYDRQNNGPQWCSCLDSLHGSDIWLKDHGRPQALKSNNVNENIVLSIHISLQEHRLQTVPVFILEANYIKFLWWQMSSHVSSFFPEAPSIYWCPLTFSHMGFM